MHHTVYGKLKLKKQTSNQNNAINHWRKLSNIKGKRGGLVNVSIRAKVKLKLPDVIEP